MYTVRRSRTVELDLDAGLRTAPCTLKLEHACWLIETARSSSGKVGAEEKP